MKKLLVVGVLTVFLQVVAMAQSANKPNILFIAVDDLKPIIGAYGNTFIKTPNLDRLASRGTTFLNNYCHYKLLLLNQLL